MTRTETKELKVEDIKKLAEEKSVQCSVRFIIPRRSCPGRCAAAVFLAPLEVMRRR